MRSPDTPTSEIQPDKHVTSTHWPPLKTWNIYWAKSRHVWLIVFRSLTIVNGSSKTAAQLLNLSDIAVCFCTCSLLKWSSPGCYRNRGNAPTLESCFLKIKKRCSLCCQVSMWPMAGERRGRWQLGKSSDRPSGITWWRRGCLPMDRDTSRAGLSFPECSKCAGITWPKQYVPSNRAFFHTIADLLVYIRGVMQKHILLPLSLLLSRSAFALGLQSFLLFFNTAWLFFFFNLIRNSFCWSTRRHERGSK